MAQNKVKNDLAIVKKRRKNRDKKEKRKRKRKRKNLASLLAQ
jgi:hypothetical protein